MYNNLMKSSCIILANVIMSSLFTRHSHTCGIVYFAYGVGAEGGREMSEEVGLENWVRNKHLDLGFHTVLSCAH